MLPALTEHGLLPVPPTVHVVPLDDLPGCFGAKPWRKQLWSSFMDFVRWLKTNTAVSEIYLDGRFLTASDDVAHVEVGIELTVELIRKSGFDVFKIPALDEYSVRVRYFAPFRPARFNFHEEFQTPDPEIRLREAPADLRKGYIQIRL
jgi:hypothetical protein